MKEIFTRQEVIELFGFEALKKAERKKPLPNIDYLELVETYVDAGSDLHTIKDIQALVPFEINNILLGKALNSLGYPSKNARVNRIPKKVYICKLLYPKENI